MKRTVIIGFILVLSIICKGQEIIRNDSINDKLHGVAEAKIFKTFKIDTVQHNKYGTNIVGYHNKPNQIYHENIHQLKKPMVLFCWLNLDIIFFLQ